MTKANKFDGFFAPIAIKVQGITDTLDPSTFHVNAMQAVFTYGARRWVQDNINSLAKAHRDDGNEVTESWVKDALAARIAQLVSGEISTRSGTSADPLDRFRIVFMRRLMRATPDGALAVAYKAIDSDDQKARIDFLLSVAAKNADTIDPEAQELSDSHDAEMAQASAFDLDVKTA